MQSNTWRADTLGNFRCFWASSQSFSSRRSLCLDTRPERPKVGTSTVGKTLLTLPALLSTGPTVPRAPFRPGLGGSEAVSPLALLPTSSFSALAQPTQSGGGERPEVCGSRAAPSELSAASVHAGADPLAHSLVYAIEAPL